MRRRLLYCISSLLTIISIGLPSVVVFANDDPDDNRSAYVAKSDANLAVPLDQLALMVKPLTLDELQVELDAWMGHLKESAVELSNLEIAIKQQKLAINKDREAASKLETADLSIAGATEALTRAKASGDLEAIKEAEQQLKLAVGEQKQANKVLDEAKELEEQQPDEVKQAARDALEEKAEEAVEAAKEAEEVATAEEAMEAKEKAADAKKAFEVVDQPNDLVQQDDPESKKEAAEQKEIAKASLAETLAERQIKGGNLIERVKVVIAAYEAKGGDPKPYNQYVAAVRGISIDVTDATASMTVLKTWLRSDDGGIKWAKTAGRFFAILFAFWIAALLIGRLTARGVEMTSKVSNLLGNFINKSVRRVIMAIGLVVALSALGVDIGPLLAAIGAAGFVIAFALQGSLSNFASGIMILMYRPFDTGDIVEAGGTAGMIESTNLFSTHIRTPDNKAIIVPNNAIWGGVITNDTHFPERRVDIVFGISYDDDVAKAQRILEELVAEHKRILKTPAPVVRVHALGDSSVNLVCRIWLETRNYWDVYWNVYWDLTRRVKEEFDANDITIPFPQRDVHLHQAEIKQPVDGQPSALDN